MSIQLKVMVVINICFNILIMDAKASDEVSVGCDDDYPEQIESLYILPYSIGSTFLVGQGNCIEGGSHQYDQKFTYDFDMPIGSHIIAARSGEVIDFEDRYNDGNRTSGEENYILIRHSDHTVAGYYHLTREGVFFDIGSTVDQGELIGFSGDTGDSTEPHLHFEVLECVDCDSLPINFRNTRQHTNGLIDQERYKAEAF